MKSGAVLEPVHIKYGKIMTGEEKLTVRMHLDRTSRNVVFSCNPEEHLGNYKRREVVFDADFKCTLLFSNDKFFTDKHLRLDRTLTGVASVSLDPNTPVSLFAAVTSGETEVNVRAKVSETEEMYTLQPKMPPILHIP